MADETRTASDARADLLARQKSAAEGIPALERAVEKAARAIVGLTVVGEIVAASGVLNTAQSALDGAKSDVAKIEKGLTALTAQADYERDLGAYNESIKPCRVVTNPLVTAIQKAMIAASETLTAAGIVSVVFRTIYTDGRPETDAELVGPSKPKPVKTGRGKSGGGGGNGGRFVNVSPDRSKMLSDREFVALVGPQHLDAEKVAHAVDLNTKGGTLYVTARSLREKAGWTRRQK